MREERVEVSMGSGAYRGLFDEEEEEEEVVDSTSSGLNRLVEDSEDAMVQCTVAVPLALGLLRSVEAEEGEDAACA